MDPSRPAIRLNNITLCAIDADAGRPTGSDASGRRILYVGEDLATSASEIFGESGNARLCPRYRVSILAPTRSLAMFDLGKQGAALAIGARLSLADGSEPRPLTQQWARAI